MERIEESDSGNGPTNRRNGEVLLHGGVPDGRDVQAARSRHAGDERR